MCVCLYALFNLPGEWKEGRIRLSNTSSKTVFSRVRRRHLHIFLEYGRGVKVCSLLRDSCFDRKDMEEEFKVCSLLTNSCF